MAISRTQSAHNQSSVSGGTLTASLTGIAANSLVVATSSWDTSGGTSGSSITDDLSVAATNRARIAPASSQAAEVWRFANYGGGSRTFTLGNSPAQTFRDMCVMEYAGAATSPDDGAVTNSGSSAAPTSGNLSPAPSVNGTLIVGFACGLTSGAPVFAAPFSDIFQETTVVGADSEDYVQPTAAAIAATWTASPSGTWNAAAASFKPAVASGGWVDSGTRRAPAKAGPFDQRGMLLSPYQQYSYVSSVTTFLVSSADGFTLYESLDGANALVSATVREESLASVAQAQAIIEEALASLSQGVTVQTEALQGLALVQAVIEESLASAAIATTVRDEANASATLGATVQDEALATASIGQTVIEEALASASLATTARYEALATALLASIIQYEAGGIASSPVSNSVAVNLESLASVSQSVTNRLEATQSIAALLTIILESGGLTNGPMAGINAIVFAAMVTLAALDLMTTVATSDSLATSATLDTLATGAASDSLITKSVFDG